MSEAPERIWAMAPHIGEFYADPPVNDEDKRFLTEYVRADLLPVVKPLEWRPHPAGLITSNNMGGAYIIDTRGNRPRWLKWPSGHGPDRETVEEMQAAAQADHDERIRSKIDMTDPAELVAGAYEAGFKDFMEMKLIGTPQDDPALSMLRALTGTETQDALDAAIAKAVNKKLEEVAAYCEQHSMAVVTQPSNAQFCGSYVAVRTYGYGEARHAGMAYAAAILAMKEPE